MKHAAEWVVVHGPGPEDYTHSCTVHLVDMLTDADEHRLYRTIDPTLYCCWLATATERAEQGDIACSSCSGTAPPMRIGPNNEHKCQSCWANYGYIEPAFAEQWRIAPTGGRGGGTE